MEQFLGQIIMVAFEFAPPGWALCNGQLLPIEQNMALFAIVGTKYGGDGVKTFGLPKLPATPAAGAQPTYLIATAGMFPSRPQ